MIIPEKRKLATMIVAGLDKKPEISVKPETDMREEQPLDIITQDIMKALESKSVMGLKDALRAFIEEHGVSGSDDQEE